MSKRHIFLADVHLRHEESAKRKALIRLISEVSVPNVHLYILGDLFDVWIGAVQFESEPEMTTVVEALRNFVHAGGKLSFFHGNRDYCMEDYFTRELGAETVPYWKIIDLDGQKTYLNHGDLLCTGDHLYHVARWFMRGRLLVRLFRHFPIGVKYSITEAYRGISKRRDPAHRREHHGINRAKVKQLIRRGVDLIICGHVHEHTDRIYCRGARQARVISLPPWHECGWILEHSDGAFTLRAVDFT